MKSFKRCRPLKCVRPELTCGRRFSLQPDKKDDRDFIVSSFPVKELPSSIEIPTPPAYNQGNVGLCFSHAGCRAFDTVFYKDTGKYLTPSRLYLGVTTRSDEGRLKQDSGASMRGTVKAMVKWGIPPESAYPYDVKKMFELPPPSVTALAEKYQTLMYYRVPEESPSLLKAALVNGHTPVFGAKIYKSFTSPGTASTGVVRMPVAGEESLGGHALTICGFSDEKKAFHVMNSWGKEWGCDNGMCWMPYDYFTFPGLVRDLWVISKTELG